jgi:hypothetical protein
VSAPPPRCLARLHPFAAHRPRAHSIPPDSRSRPRRTRPAALPCRAATPPPTPTGGRCRPPEPFLAALGPSLSSLFRRPRIARLPWPPLRCVPPGPLQRGTAPAASRNPPPPLTGPFPLPTPATASVPTPPLCPAHRAAARVSPTSFSLARHLRR